MTGNKLLKNAYDSMLRGISQNRGMLGQDIYKNPNELKAFVGLAVTQLMELAGIDEQKEKSDRLSVKQLEQVHGKVEKAFKLIDKEIDQLMDLEARKNGFNSFKDLNELRQGELSNKVGEDTSFNKALQALKESQQEPQQGQDTLIKRNTAQAFGKIINTISDIFREIKQFIDKKIYPKASQALEEAVTIVDKAIHRHGRDTSSERTSINADALREEEKSNRQDLTMQGASEENKREAIDRSDRRRLESSNVKQNSTMAASSKESPDDKPILGKFTAKVAEESQNKGRHQGGGGKQM